MPALHPPGERSAVLRGLVVAIAAGAPQLAARIAQALWLDGADVALLGDARELQATRQALGTAAPTCFAVQTVLDDPAEVESALDDVVDRHLALDVLVGLAQVPPRTPGPAGLPERVLSAQEWDARVSAPLCRAQWLGAAALRHMRLGRGRGLVLLVHAPDERQSTLEGDALGHALLGLAEGFCRDGRAHGIEARVLHALAPAASPGLDGHRLLVNSLLDEAVPPEQRAHAGLALTARWLCRLSHQGLLRPAPALPPLNPAPSSAPSAPSAHSRPSTVESPRCKAHWTRPSPSPPART